jgi:phosphomannomutase/phosphoglucomutase
MNFGTTGVRGLFDEVNGRTAYEIGNIFAPQLGKNIVVAMDHRLTSPSVYHGLISGIMEGGSDAIELGYCPSPVAEFYNTFKRYDGLFIVTASHNPPEYNGIKIADKRGVIINKEVSNRMAAKGMSLVNWNCVGRERNREESAAAFYMERVLELIDRKRLKGRRFVVDYGNGVTIDIFSKLLKELGLDTIWLNATMDGTFPGRDSDPSSDNLEKLMETCKSHGIPGIAFDGDGDRLSMVDEDGRFVSGDIVFALAVRKMYEEGLKGDVASTLASSKLINHVVESAGFKVRYTRIGATYVAEKMLEDGMMAGGEEVGGTIWKGLSLAKDGMFTALKVLEMLDKKKLKDLVAELPIWHIHKEKIRVDSSKKAKLMEKVREEFRKDKAVSIDDDTMRVDYKDYWVLVRASGTEPIIRVFASSMDKTEAERIGKELHARIDAMHRKIAGLPKAEAEETQKRANKAEPKK